jgi:hypothetical protein
MNNKIKLGTIIQIISNVEPCEILTLLISFNFKKSLNVKLLLKVKNWKIKKIKEKTKNKIITIKNIIK